ncbi:alpha-glucosidase, family GH31 [Zostera marina]|uniref:Alpha-glucosidase, family GH31 n=1 Tax=Zostera marina TaxID=29655 RepID=A0A0K9Q333_ZOSMR|nr:alpha-glucosidase, family GH31 [Zostera marina]
MLSVISFGVNVSGRKLLIAESATSSLLSFPNHRRKKDLGSFDQRSQPLHLRRWNYIACQSSNRPISQMVDCKGDDATIQISGVMVFEPILEEGVFRFDCSANDKQSAFPSVSFIDPKERDIAIISQKLPQYVPICECIHGQQIVNIQLPTDSSFYGTGEVSGQLERTGKRVFTWNTDAWGYGSETTSLYQSHPWVLVILPDGKALGVLADTTARCEIDLREECNIKLASLNAYPVITFGPFESPTDVLISLSHAIGTVFMPPKWSLGYHQCRWSYDSDAKVRKIAKTFREKGIPCDVIWMDIDYMDGFRCFTFDKERFPDPKCLTNDLHAIGFNAIWMLDPGIKHDPGYFVYDNGTENDVWVLNKDKQTFIGDVWPGPCVFPDYTQEKIRMWWANLVKDFTSNGVDGIWNDMNEPSVFKSVTKTMPESNFHRGDIELGGHQCHSHYHNVYGLLMAKSTYEGLKMAEENKRPFVLTRAGFVGSQRYAATWTGDNLANWDHLHMSISMVLQMSLSGQPLSGPDIGGFSGNATPKLFGRWMGVGAMFPFCRGHSETDTTDHEPWSFGEECEEVCRLALARRYRLLPHLYTLFYFSHTKGSPVVMPLFFADTKDPDLRKVEDSFLLGPLLICASTTSIKGSEELPDKLPKGIWMPFDFGDPHPDLPNLYLQGGSIVPTGPSVQHVGEINLTDTITLLVALDKYGKAEGTLFEDDGDGYEFTHGNYLLTHYVAELKSSVFTVKVSKTEGSWKRPKRFLRVQLLIGEFSMFEAQGIDGEDLHISLPPENEISKLVLKNKNQHNYLLERTTPIPDFGETSDFEGMALAKTPVELRSGEWILKLIPWIGGRMNSMVHVPTGSQWICSRLDADGYVESSGVESHSIECSKQYNVTAKIIAQSGENQSLSMEADIGGGLILERQISILKDSPKIVQINSGIIARNVGAGSGGFSRLVCLRIHPQFTLQNPTAVFVSFISLNGSTHEILPVLGEKRLLDGNLRPNGKWMLVDKRAGTMLVNHFDPDQVNKCLIHWGACSVNLELWSEERPVSDNTPIMISHQYEVKLI